MGDCISHSDKMTQPSRRIRQSNSMMGEMYLPEEIQKNETKHINQMGRQPKISKNMSRGRYEIEKHHQQMIQREQLQNIQLPCCCEQNKKEQSLQTMICQLYKEEGLANQGKIDCKIVIKRVEYFLAHRRVGKKDNIYFICVPDKTGESTLTLKEALQFFAEAES